MTSPAKRVVVAMSGGVDSSVAAALLVEQGYEVIGMMLRLWSEPGSEGQNRCCTPEAMSLARRVAARLGIPFYVVDARQPFRQKVVEYFLDGYTQGVTPNPCLACNRSIRWGLLLQQALALGASAMATGHYARLEPAVDGGLRLLRAVDEHKDQSYVLHVLNQEQLRQAFFPLGGYTKPEVRDLARRFDLPVAERSDSQDLCFLAGEDYRAFLQRHAPQAARPGPILDSQGNPLGEHQGLANYTIGQRKGLTLTRRPAGSLNPALIQPEAVYVLGKDAARNALVVGYAAELGRSELETGDFHWIAAAPPAAPFRAKVKIRYTARPAWGFVSPDGARVRITFDEPQRDITPGQAAVVYVDDEVLGGGIIQVDAPHSG